MLKINRETVTELYVLNWGVDSHYTSDVNIVRTCVFTSIEMAISKAMQYDDNMPEIVVLDIHTMDIIKTISSPEIIKINEELCVTENKAKTNHKAIRTIDFMKTEIKLGHNLEQILRTARLSPSLDIDTIKLNFGKLSN